MSGISKSPVDDFIRFNESEFDERELARMVANRFKTNHHEHVVTYDSAPATRAF